MSGECVGAWGGGCGCGGVCCASFYRAKLKERMLDGAQKLITSNLSEVERS